MVIPFEDINNSPFGAAFVGSRSRLASCTGVHFVDSDRIVVTNLVGMRIYLVRFDLDAGTHEIEFTGPTRFGGEDVATHLLDFDGRDRLVTSNWDSASVSLYRFAGDRIDHGEDIPIIDDQAGLCHGVKFVPGGDLVCATCTNEYRNIYFVSTGTGEVVYRFDEPGWVPKDVCFVGDGRIVVVYCDAANGGELMRSKASLIAYDLESGSHEVMADELLEDCHVDCCAWYDGAVFLTNQHQDTVQIYELEDDALGLVAEIGGYDFPHGVDVHRGSNLLAVTNYGSNSVSVNRF
jgi:hypothetical protein